MVFNPFGMGSARQGLYNQQAYSGQQAQQPYDFKGLDERLGKLETGIAGLTDQFKNFQTPGQETIQEGYTNTPTPPTEYSGNNAPPPLESTAPVGAIESAAGSTLAPTAPAPEPAPILSDSDVPQVQHNPTSMEDWLGDYEFLIKPTMDTNRWEFEKKYRDENPIAPIDFSDANRDIRPWQEQRTNMAKAWGQEQEAFRNTPEYLEWQKKNEARGDLSRETIETMQGGESYTSNAGNRISAYIRGGGGSYEDYLSTHEKMKEARPQIEELRQNWQGNQSQSMLDQMNAIYQSVGLTGGIGGNQLINTGTAAGGGQQQQLSRMRAPDPTKMMGGVNWTPMGQEEYEKQYDLWGKHMDYRKFSEAASSQMGKSGEDMTRFRFGPNPMFGHAFEAWNQFNQGQEGGPWTNPDQSRSQFQNISLSALDPVRHAEQIAQSKEAMGRQNATLGAGIGALQGPTQQKIQQGIGALTQGAGI